MAMYVGLDTIKDKAQRGIFKRILRKAYNQGMPCGVSPLTESPRIRYEDAGGYGEYWKEYGFFNGAGMSDDDIREYIDENIRVRIYSPYDCTGEAFTMWIWWHRNPSGLVSYINNMALDV